MKKWPEAGIIFCEAEQLACAFCSTEDGSCTEGRCNIHDPEYIAKQKKIEETRLKNYEHHRQMQLAEAKNPPAPIRNNSGKVENKIEALREKARYYHLRGWKRKAFEIEDRIAELRRHYKS